MSRMQEALSREDYDHANAAVPVAVMFEANTQERSEKRPNHTRQGKSDRGRLSRSDILWIVRHSVPKDDSPGLDKTEQPAQPPKVAKGNPFKARKRPAARSVSFPRDERALVQPGETKRVALAAQVRSFQERSDLRACLLPGMMSKISPNACEGWQRQATVRTSRIMAKMKLDACKNCQYRLEPEAAQQ